MVKIIPAMLEGDNEQGDWWDEISPGVRQLIKASRELEEGRVYPTTDWSKNIVNGVQSNLRRMLFWDIFLK